MKTKTLKAYILGLTGILIAVIIFATPFYFMFVNSIKDRKEANDLNISFPLVTHFENFIEVLKADNGLMLLSFKNSIIITLFSVILLIILGSMTGFIIARNHGKFSKIFNLVLLSGLMVPPAIMPTIWVLQGLHIYKTLLSLILINGALQLPFTVMLYRGYMSTIPLELEESAVIDGCNSKQLFAKIIFPLLKPVTSTIIILVSVNIFNDFTNPLYFLPGRENSTIQLTLYNYMGQFASSYNLLFANVIIITIPMLILFIIFNKRIVDGMVSGAVKG